MASTHSPSTHSPSTHSPYHYPSSPSASSHSSSDHLAYTPCSVQENPRASNRLTISHPYARLYAKKEQVKRRKIWNHALEKSLFSPYEISTIGAPQRRTIYIASLEAHIDKLHAQLLDVGFWPIPMDELKPYHGLNSKTAKSIVSGLQHDASVARLKMLELERANKSLSISLQLEPPQASATHPELTPYSTLPQPSSAYSVPSVYSPNVSANAKHCTQL